MSRSWERKVRKNTSSLNKQLKKQGKTGFTGTKPAVEKFKGRNYILPILILLFTGTFTFMMTSTPGLEDDSTMLYVTIGAYVLLALLFFMRRPYLAVGKDFLGTRRMTGDKTLNASGIRKIVLQNGYVMIVQAKGPSWMFSRLLNRFPTDAMAERLKRFASENAVELEIR